MSLIPGSERKIHERLRVLYHKQLLNRFAFRKDNRLQEFNYYIDSTKTLQLLTQRAGYTQDDLHWNWVRYNREKRYDQAARSNEKPDSLRWLIHELMISRFHAMLDWACWHSDGRVQLTDWKRGRGELRTRVELPKVTRRRSEGEWQWSETDELESVLFEPDFFFELHYPELPEDQQHARYFYEAERGSGNATKFAQRLRAYFHFIVKQKKHQEVYNIPRIHGVLTEAETPSWKEGRRQAARAPIVSGKPSGLFLFTDSEQLTEPSNHPRRPRFITEPTRIFEQVWHTPHGNEPISLLER